ncbi:MAG: nuclear transport factor 2 family protein, partial [Alteraurantiacibacter sp.]
MSAGGPDLEAKLAIVDARQEIANLQARYLHYAQSHEYDRLLALFEFADPEVLVEISSTGVYIGEEKIRAFFLEFVRPLFTSAGSLPIHVLNTQCIEIAPGGLAATGMWQTIRCN